MRAAAEDGANVARAGVFESAADKGGRGHKGQPRCRRLAGGLDQGFYPNRVNGRQQGQIHNGPVAGRVSQELFEVAFGLGGGFHTQPAGKSGQPDVSFTILQHFQFEGRPEEQLQPFLADDDFDGAGRRAEVGVAARRFGDAVHLIVAVGGVVVGGDQLLHPRLLGNVHADHGRGVAPVGFREQNVAQRILAVEGQGVGVGEEIGEAAQVFFVELLVFAVGGKDEDALAIVEAVSVGDAGMIEGQAGDGHPPNLHRFAFMQLDEGHVGPHLFGGNGEEGGGRLLMLQVALRVVVDGIEDELVAGNVGGVEEGEALQVVPVGVGEEDVGCALPPAKFVGHEREAEPPHAGAAVNNDRVVAAVDFDASGVAAHHAPGGRGQGGNKGAHLSRVGQIDPSGGAQSAEELLFQLFSRKGRRNRPAHAPEFHTHRCASNYLRSECNMEARLAREGYSS